MRVGLNVGLDVGVFLITMGVDEDVLEGNAVISIGIPVGDSLAIFWHAVSAIRMITKPKDTFTLFSN